MIEAWGRGIERIFNACRIQDIPLPELNYEQTGLWIIFHFTAKDIPSAILSKTLVKTTIAVIEILETNPKMTLAEVTASIGKSLSAVERASAKLVKEGWLRYIGLRKGGHWEKRNEMDLQK